jgi:hypothetical protein
MTSPEFQRKVQEFHDKQTAKGSALLAELGTDECTDTPEPKEVPVPVPKSNYSHEVLIDLIIANPTWSHKQYAAHFGRTASWFASILATNGFQEALDPRRNEVSDPTITATMDERLRALMLRGLAVLQTKLEDPKVQDATVLKATEIGVRALGLGTLRDNEAPSRPETGSIANLAEALVHRMKTTGVGRLSGPAQDVEILREDKS